MTHNRKKQYLLEEGTVIPPLVDMGVFTPEGKIIRSHYDKYRQINRFVEILEDELKCLDLTKTLHILDFGCGKSYLTFIVYYYLVCVRKLKVHMTGLDLKEDVIKNCNAAAARYGIIKERMAALMTDAIRANLLTCVGYDTSILEFVDLSHTPKNLLIRAVKSGVSDKKKEKAMEEVQNLMNEFSVRPMLYTLLYGEDEKKSGKDN